MLYAMVSVLRRATVSDRDEIAAAFALCRYQIVSHRSCQPRLDRSDGYCSLLPQQTNNKAPRYGFLASVGLPSCSFSL